LTVRRREVLPLAGRAMEAEGRVGGGLSRRLARVYGCAASRAAVDEAVRAERLAGGIMNELERVCGGCVGAWCES
jgi:hypothetical protein